jgi:hypothetical protein
MALPTGTGVVHRAVQIGDTLDHGITEAKIDDEGADIAADNDAAPPRSPSSGPSLDVRTGSLASRLTVATPQVNATRGTSGCDAATPVVTASASVRASPKSGR